MAWGKPVLLSVTAKGAQLRGRWENGRLSFGTLDKLAGQSSGGPFTLPDVDVRIENGRLHLDTPQGAVGMAIEGHGRLSDGFEGQVAVITRHVVWQGCTIHAPAAYLHVTIEHGQPLVDGPVRARQLVCNGAQVARPDIALDVRIGEDFDRWIGNALVRVDSLQASGNAAGASMAKIAFDGETRGKMHASGTVELTGVSASSTVRRTIITTGASLAATPAGPVAAALANAFAQASLLGQAEGEFDAVAEGSDVRIALTHASGASGTSARFVFDSAGGPVYDSRGQSRWEGGKLELSGGGLPDISADLRTAGRSLAGTIEIGALAVQSGPVAFDPIRLMPGRIVTRVVMDGPVGTGRVNGLVLPVDIRFRPDGQLAVNPGCTTIGFQSLSIAGTTLAAAKLPVCAVGPALVTRSAGGAIGGGARLADLDLGGQVGSAPFHLKSGPIIASLGGRSFSADAVGVRLGEGSSPTLLDIGRLAGRFDGSAGLGAFDRLSGRIGAVPLLFSEGAGKWSFADGALKLGGHLAVDDAQAASPRLRRLVADDVALSLVDGRILTTATLKEPKTGRAVTAVSIRHDLAAGSGDARLTVRNLAFDKTFQPELVTPLTLGVVADLRGTIGGEGRIRWTQRGVTSSGDFSSDSLDLAAAFGPVRGLSGMIHFSDLLALTTPPGQIAKVAEVNPGVAVTGGVIRYQLLANQNLRIESGEWPFSGGNLTLQPTLLDLGRPSERRLTFRVDGMDGAKFVEQFAFKNIAVTGTFDGTLPIIFDANGGRIEGGRLAVRKGGGRLAYVGEVSNAQLGRFARLAFDALKSIRYDGLVIDLNGSLDGEIVSQVNFTGTNEAPLKPNKGGLLSQFTGLPFRFRITIDAPFRSLVNSAESLTDPRGLIHQQIPDAVVEP
jgi:hypothetical protein